MLARSALQGAAAPRVAAVAMSSSHVPTPAAFVASLPGRQPQPRRTACRATDQDAEASGAPPPPPAAAPRPPPPTGRPRPMPPPPNPFGPGVKVLAFFGECNIERVERIGEEGWAGIAAVDRGEDNQPSSLACVLNYDCYILHYHGHASTGRGALLAGGDVAALLLFAAVGRLSHGEGLSLGDLLATAGPFLAGWLPAAALLGCYGKEASQRGAVPAAATAAKAWAVGIPAGLVLRSLVRGYVPETAFIVVSLSVTAVLLVGWRAGLAAATPQEKALSAAEQLKARKNKRGGPLEFFKLLGGLVGRW